MELQASKDTRAEQKLQAQYSGAAQKAENDRGEGRRANEE